MTTTIDVSNEAQLNQAIATVDAATTGAYVIQFTTTIAEGTDSGGTTVFHGTTVDLPPDLFALNVASGVSLTIDGAGKTLDGGNSYRGFFAYSGDVTIENLTIANADAVGGAGALGGGGGAGLGGGLFVAGTTQGSPGASVTLDGVNFSNDRAVGGAGGAGLGGSSDGGGGGGLGGAGGSAQYGAGGGGIGNKASGGAAGAPGAGIVLGAASGGAGSVPGGAYGGGGAVFPESGAGGGVGGFASSGNGLGAPGGFGGGGGGGNNNGGAGGFGGGGGGSASYGGGGGFGGGGGGGSSSGGLGGFGGGRGGALGGAGGGGLGAGGDIFVQQGGALVIEGGTLSGGGVAGGASSSAFAGEALGSGLFLQGTQSQTLDSMSGQTLVITDNLTDQGANGGTGHAGLVIGGGGTVILDGTTSLTGTISLEFAFLQIGDASHTTATDSAAISFGGPAELGIYTTADNIAFTAPVSNFGLGETIDLNGINPGGVTFNAGTIDYSLPGGGAEAFDLGLASGFTAGQVVVSSDNGSGTLIELCFLRGTMIATPSGEMPVEALRPGDRVLTIEGESEPVRWIGTGRHVVPADARVEASPVVVRAGALADRVPCRDLRITKGHALYLDGVLVPVEALVNGLSITFDARPQTVELFHVELDRHAVLIADGAPAESFRDDGNAVLFQNARREGAPALPPFAPVLASGPVVDRLWHRLAERAGVVAPPAARDADLHLLADGRRVEAHLVASGLHVFRLPDAPSALRIRSRAGVPLALGRSADRRRLGVGLAAIVLRDANGSVALAPDAAALDAGFHAPEPELRWTDGDAAIPAALLAGLRGPLSVELRVAATAAYPAAA